MSDLLSKFAIGKILIIVLIGFLSQPYALASGGDSGGGGGTDVHKQVMYNKGKKLFKQKVVCDSCPYSELVLETAAVEQVWPQMKDDFKKNGQIGKNLKGYQRKSLKYYVKERFEL